MSKESMTIVKTSTEELKSKKKQLAALQAKETEEIEKVAKLSKLLEQARIDHDTCMRSHIAGNVSDHDLKESKAKIKELTDSIQEAKEALKFISETRPKLMSEISFIDGERTMHRAAICSKLAKEAHDEMAANKKLNEKLAAGYAAFLSSGDYDMSWSRYLMCCFPPPPERGIQIAVDEFKLSNEFMRD